ncbi:T9SS type A sorting domain-containing protein [Flavobacterium sp.]|uniref:T9SS type A sorting domain-containing protein n=1 Tax=Flavobacterium sp. TaxID=239 RepID=UPI00375198CF
MNPTSNFINISSINIIDKVEIYNIIGNLVMKTNVNVNKIDVSNFSKGIYLISVYSALEKSLKKIIVN